MVANPAFKNGRADRQRAFGKRPWRRAAQRDRYAAAVRDGLLRGAQYRMLANGQDIPAQGAAEVF